MLPRLRELHEALSLAVRLHGPDLPLCMLRKILDTADLVPGAPLLDDALPFQLGTIYRRCQLSGQLDLLFCARDFAHGSLPAGRLIAPLLLGLAQRWMTAGVSTRGR